MYAKDIREVNKEEMVSRSYIVAKFCLLGCHCLNLGIESLFKAAVYRAGHRSSHL